MVRDIGVVFHTLHYYWAEECGLLYRGFFSIHFTITGLKNMVCYIGVLFHTLHYYWAEEYGSLYRGSFPYIYLHYYWAEEYRSLYRGLRYKEVR